MPTTKQAAAIQAASDLTNLVQTIKGVRDAAQAFLTKYNSESYSATWSAMPTGTQNADGTIGLIDQTAGSGTVSVTAGSAAVTFSAGIPVRRHDERDRELGQVRAKHRQSHHRRRHQPAGGEARLGGGHAPAARELLRERGRGNRQLQPVDRRPRELS